ncbi:MAG: hypothetical protein ACLU4N_00715 [Butyricimonas faecihominis]
MKVLINEISKPYFNNDFFHLSLLNEGEDIIWWSERTGHGHLSLRWRGKSEERDTAN